MKAVLKLVGFLSIVCAVLILWRDPLAKIIFEKRATAATGLPIKIKDINLDLVNFEVRARSLKLFNPEGEYEKRLMLEAPEIYLSYDPGDLIRGRLHIEDMEIYVKRFVIVKNAEGKLNIEYLRWVMDPQAAASRSTPSMVHVDLLTLVVDKVIYMDYSKRKGKPYVKEFNVNYTRTFKDVADPSEVTGILVSRMMTLTSIADLTRFNLTQLNQSLLGITEVTSGTTLSKLTSLTKRAWTTTGRSIAGTAEKAIKQIA